MKCYKHPDRDAVGICTECGRFVCEGCSVFINSKMKCKDCISAGSVKSKNKGGKVDTEAFKNTVNNYASKASDIANDTVSKVKDYSQSDDFKNTIETVKSNPNVVNLIFGILALLTLTPKVFNLIRDIPYLIGNIVENVLYFELFDVVLNLLNYLVSFISIGALVILAALLIKRFIEIDNILLIVLPIIIAVIYGVVGCFINGLYYGYFYDSIGYVYYGIKQLIIPVIFITVGGVIDRYKK